MHWRRIFFWKQKEDWSHRESDFQHELLVHLKEEEEEQHDAGLSAEEARYAALRAFGNQARITEEIRAMSISIWMEQLAKNFRYAVRALRKQPGFAAIAVISLALGIGANTSIFSITDQMLLRSLPVKDPNRLVLLSWNGQFIGGSSRGYRQSFSYPMYVDLRDNNPGVFTGIAGRWQEIVDLADHGPVERATAELVSGNYFDTLGVGAALGRTLTMEDDKVKDAEPYAVVSYEYWQRRMGGDPSVLNRVIDINGHPMTIVGVVQHGFEGFEAMHPTDVFVSLMMKNTVTPTWDDMARRNSIWLKLFARLSPGVSGAAAKSAMSVAYQTGLRNDLAAVSRNEQFGERYLKNKLIVGDASKGIGNLQTFFSKPLYVLLGMVGTLLLIACVNLASLLLSRSAARQKEIAIRLSLGASRKSLVALILTESLVIALAGGAVGVLLSIWVTSSLVRFLPYDNIDVAIHAVPDWRILGFAAGLSLFTAILFGLLPALRASRPDLARTLKDESGSVSVGRGQMRVRRLLVAAQVMLSLVLLMGAGLFARSLYKLMSIDTGIASSQLVQFTVDPSLHKFTPERSRQYFLDLQTALGRMPGADSASASSFPLLANDAWENTVRVEGFEHPDQNSQAGWNEMLPGFFSTAGVPLLMGREFTPADVAGAPKVVIVNETFAKHYFANDNPVGHRVGFGGSTVPLDMQIVGVVKDLKTTDLKEEPKPYTFTPALQNAQPSAMTFYVRSRQNPRILGQAARQAAGQVDATIPLYEMKSVEAQINETHFMDRLFAFLSAAFASLATLMACIGLYGVTAMAVSRRTQEFGVRMALGATRANIFRLVLGEVVLLTLAGIAVGVPAGLASAKLVASLLYGMSGRNFAVTMAAVAVIVVVSLLAAYLPARRATRIDPIQALRYE
ncbi:MAG TPA: ABC transporter permease [Candidatus Acidoferrales bacterium]|nr:ABC transporter permease [Candidatus Acidoferrales bacterium]